MDHKARRTLWDISPASRRILSPSIKQKVIPATKKLGDSDLKRGAKNIWRANAAARCMWSSPADKWRRNWREAKSAAGQAVYSTLDRELQKQVAQALGDMPGAAIVLNMNTGEVLAFASSPAFDPNLFDPTNLNASALSKVLNDPNRPLVNRATQSLLPPGSVFKVVNVASGLISGLYDRDTTYTCTGVWSELGESFKKYDWTVAKDLPPHGKINLPEALTFSCNPYNYHIAYDVYKKDQNLLPKTAREFGLGKPTGIIGFLENNNEEVGGLVPDAAWKQKSLGEQWTAGDTVNMAIGQGYLQVTPLQIANMYAAIGNGGTLYRPQLVSKIAAPGETPVYEFKTRRDRQTAHQRLATHHHPRRVARRDHQPKGHRLQSFSRLADSGLWQNRLCRNSGRRSRHTARLVCRLHAGKS